MKKFQFRLEGYLRIKEIEERQKMAELAQVVGEVSRERAQIQNYFDESARLVDEQRNRMFTREFDIQYNRTVQNYFYVLERRRKVAERRIDELQVELAEKQRIANEARKKRRVIEILKAQKKSEHDQMVAREEAKQLDEFNSKIHQRRIMTTGDTIRVSEMPEEKAKTLFTAEEVPEEKSHYTEEDLQDVVEGFDLDTFGFGS